MDNLQDMIDSIQKDGEDYQVKHEQSSNPSKDKICKKCHQPGHFANKCPVMNEKKKAKMKCHICGQTGHNRNSCPGVEDGGAAQSTHKGNSTAKNNTGEKKKKGKDKVRAQKMMRGKKKERGQSIDEKEVATIAFPDTSIQFHDFLSGELNESFDNENDGDDNNEISHPCALLAGFISPYTLCTDNAYALTFNQAVPSDSPGLLGYSLGLSPRSSAQWLQHIALNNGEDVVLTDAVTSLGSLLRGFGPIGLDYSEKTTAQNSHADQQEVFRRMVALATESASTDAASPPRFLLITAVAPTQSSVTPSSSVFNLPGQEKSDENDVINIDRDIFKVLYDSLHLQESSISIVINLADCGLKYSTIEALMTTFPNLYFAIDGRITHAKQKLIKEYAFDIPLSRFVFASMAPLYPVASSCLNGVSMDAAKSVHILFIADTLATLKNVTLDEVMEKCLENSNRILGIEGCL